MHQMLLLIALAVTACAHSIPGTFDYIVIGGGTAGQADQDINSWGLLGNKNWSWDLLDPFYKKSEHFVQPSSEIAAALETGFIEQDLHGSGGPIWNGFPDILKVFDKAWPRTYEKLGLSVQSDPRNGLALGGYTNTLNLDLRTRSRSYAARTYLKDARPRPNFRAITGALVQKVLFDTSYTKPKATGAEYSLNGTMYTINARKEVILSAGAFGSPQLLELSGIGSPKILRKNSIRKVVSNANVGENLQDHNFVTLGYKVRPGIYTLDDLKNETLFNEAYEQYVSNRTGLLATTSAMSALLSLEQMHGHENAELSKAIKRFCPSMLNGRSDDLHASGKAEHLRQSILCSSLHHDAVVQNIGLAAGMSPQFSNDTSKLFGTTTPGNFFTILSVLEHPFSRGSVHITSANASQYPEIDPKYLSHPLDVKLLSAVALHAQKVVQTEPLAGLLVDNGTAFQPGYHKLTADNAEAWVRHNLQTEYHPCGTCAMLPRESGGVVDERFRVYGVDGLRVVDASIFPLIPRANLQTLVYAVAERAADFIKHDASGAGE